MPLQKKSDFFHSLYSFFLPYQYWALQSSYKFLISSLHVLECVLFTEPLWSTCPVNKHSGYMKKLEIELSFNHRVIPTRDHLQPYNTRYKLKTLKIEMHSYCKTYLYYSNVQSSTIIDNYLIEQDEYPKKYTYYMCRNFCPILDKDSLHMGGHDLLDILYIIYFLPLDLNNCKALPKMSRFIKIYTLPEQITINFPAGFLKDTSLAYLCEKCIFSDQSTSVYTYTAVTVRIAYDCKDCKVNTYIQSLPYRVSCFLGWVETSWTFSIPIRSFCCSCWPCLYFQTCNLCHTFCVKISCYYNFSSLAAYSIGCAKKRSDILDWTFIFPFICIKHSKCNIKVYMSILTKCLM